MRELMRDAAEQQFGEASVTTPSNDDHGRVNFVGNTGECVSGYAIHHLRPVGNARRFEWLAPPVELANHEVAHFRLVRKREGSLSLVW